MCYNTQTQIFAPAKRTLKLILPQIIAEEQSTFRPWSAYHWQYHCSLWVSTLDEAEEGVGPAMLCAEARHAESIWPGGVELFTSYYDPAQLPPALGTDDNAFGYFCIFFCSS